jgi:GT2 family glycosyltransferase
MENVMSKSNPFALGAAEQSAAQAAKQSVMISVLNWNSAEVTLQCLDSLMSLLLDPSVSVRIVVIDNGSKEADYRRLADGLDLGKVTLLRQETNLGFAGGHNVATRIAMDEGTDFIWLVNSDAVVDPDCLGQLVALMLSRPDCGAASPFIVSLEDDRDIDFCGARHDWRRLESERAGSLDEARRWEQETPDAMWLAGTVVLYRVAALKQVGMLDDSLFAYYEDDEIGARLAQGGWRSLIAFDAKARHLHPANNMDHRPPYYFYLMTRNAILFWLKHTPAPYRRFLRLKLLDRSLFLANILSGKGQHEKARACMLGTLDGMLGRGGQPRLERRVPRLVDLLRRIMLVQHGKHIAAR